MSPLPGRPRPVCRGTADLKKLAAPAPGRLRSTAVDSFVPTLALFALVISAAAAALRYLPRAAFWVSALLALAFPFLSDTSDWDTWFDWAKRYSVVIPVFILATIRYRPDHPASRVFARWMPWVLIVNILEGAALDLLGPSPVNGACLAAVALLVPWRFTWDEPSRHLGFRDPLWQVATLSALTRLYVLNPQFENVVACAIVVLWLTSLACLLERDSQGYTTWRGYTLYVLVLQDSIFPSFSERLYPAWLLPENRARLAGTTWGDAWLVLNVLLVAAVVLLRVRAWRAARTTAAAVSRA